MSVQINKAMYTREQASQIRQDFWMRFGKYLLPILSSEGEKVNWVNYKTGIRNLFFRMNVTKDFAEISIDIMHRDPAYAKQLFQQFVMLRAALEIQTGEPWVWEESAQDEHGQPLSRIYRRQEGQNIFRQEDWPAIISFLKPRIIALDAFWCDYKMLFEMIN